MDGIFDQVQCWRVGSHQVEFHLNLQLGGQRGIDVLHLSLVGRVSVKKHVKPVIPLGLVPGRQIGKILGDLLGFGHRAGPEAVRRRGGTRR